MKKAVILTIVLGMMIANQAFSQMKPFRFGLKVAPSISWISPDSEDYENEGSMAGFSWGFISDFTITENYFVGTGFNINYLNGKLAYPALNPDSLIVGDSIPDPGMLKRKYNLRYIEVPLTLKMKTNKFDNLQFYGQIGFAMAFNIKARSQDVFIADETSDQYEDERDISDEITLVKGALLLGGGLEFYLDNSTSIVTGVMYSNGISNILKGDNTKNPIITQKASAHYIELTLGVIF